MNDRVLYETHSHTELCKHAQGSVKDYAMRAEERGFKGHTVTCHNPLPWGWSPQVRMFEEQFQEYLDMIHEVREAFAGHLDILTGMEFDYVPELEDYLLQQVTWADFDYCLGSIHPQTDYYLEKYKVDDEVENRRIYFDLIAKIAESDLFDCVSHPDLIKNFMPDVWDIDQAMTDIIPMLDRVAATGCAMELNTSGIHKKIAEMNPGSEILREMQNRDIPVVIGSDAHIPNRVGAQWEEALDMLESVGYTEINYFIQRQRTAVAISDARNSLLTVHV
ncbi:histidinol-phosphatase [Poriferisphaera sp. WC338]|uniref:histidinol-phosphatase n=1 Tax=Poriferisphaera sp. WC338 TaxID=3425129 RepID=UPI003D8142C0